MKRLADGVDGARRGEQCVADWSRRVNVSREPEVTSVSDVNVCFLVLSLRFASNGRDGPYLPESFSMLQK